VSGNSDGIGFGGALLVWPANVLGQPCRQFSKRVRSDRIEGDELPVESSETEEILQFCKSSWEGHVSDRCGLGVQGVYTELVDNMSQKLDLFKSNGTLFWIESQVCRLHLGKQELQVFRMIFERIRSHNDIINVTTNPFDKLSQELVHIALLMGWRTFV
jgi:hypothetical protein